MDLWLKIERPRRGVKLSLGVEEISSAAYRQRPRTGREQADGLVHEIVGSLPIRAQCRQFNVGEPQARHLACGQWSGCRSAYRLGRPRDAESLAAAPSPARSAQGLAEIRPDGSSDGYTAQRKAPALFPHNRLDLERQVVLRIENLSARQGAQSGRPDAAGPIPCCRFRCRTCRAKITTKFFPDRHDVMPCRIAFDALAIAVPCDWSRLAQHYPCRSSHSGCNRLVGSPPDLRSRQKAQNM